MIEVAVLGLGRVTPELLRRPLEPRGYRVLVMHDQSELDARLDSSEPLSALLLPHRLAGGGAAATIAKLKLRRAGEATSAILVGVEERVRGKVVELGADAYLPVPFSDDDVLKVLGAITRVRKLILLCDDSPLIHKHTTPILEQAGYDVVSAFDGEEGIDKARQIRPQLVITDVEMPKKDGYQLCREIKSDPELSHVPVLICSSLGEAADLQRGFDAGTDDYLVKPVAPVEVTSAVRELLAGGMPASRELILVVDDSAMTRLVVSDCLARQGFKIETAENGRVGLEKAKALKPSLIISDYEMPEMNGFEMVVELKRHEGTEGTPVILLSARDSSRDHKQMEAAGATACLVKPFTRDKCIVTVERVLAEARLEAFKRGAASYLADETFHQVEERSRVGDMTSRAESCEASILFTDIKGFTPLAGSMGPMDVIKMLNEYFDALVPQIKHEGGDIDKFIGDAIMAVFVPRPNLDPPPVRAVRAGLAMQAVMRDFQPWREPRILTRVGVNTGPVVRGDLGSQERREITVIGDAVNRANRFESACPPGSVMVSQSTYDTLPEGTDAVPHHGIALKGVAEPVTGWEIRSLPPRSEAGA